MNIKIQWYQLGTLLIIANIYNIITTENQSDSFWTVCITSLILLAVTLIACLPAVLLAKTKTDILSSKPIVAILAVYFIFSGFEAILRFSGFLNGSITRYNASFFAIALFAIAIFYTGINHEAIIRSSVIIGSFIFILLGMILLVNHKFTTFASFYMDNDLSMNKTVKAVKNIFSGYNEIIALGFLIGFVDKKPIKSIMFYVFGGFVINIAIVFMYTFILGDLTYITDFPMIKCSGKVTGLVLSVATMCGGIKAGLFVMCANICINRLFPKMSKFYQRLIVILPISVCCLAISFLRIESIYSVGFYLLVIAVVISFVGSVSSAVSKVSKNSKKSI